MNSSVEAVFTTAAATQASSGDGSERVFLSDEERRVAEQAVVLIMLPINLMGIFTNLINIRVFFAQGVRNDNTNIGFVTLSIFDLFGCATLIPYCLCYVVTPASDVHQRATCIAIANQFFYPHVMMQKSSAWTTVYISIVRSLCVIVPLKVKMLFTLRVSITVISTIFFFAVVALLVYTLFTEIVWVFDPQYNTTIPLVKDTPFGQEYLYYYSMLSNQVFSLLAIVLVSITSALLVYKLIQVKKWRQAGGQFKYDSRSSDKKPLASKDIELVKSVITATGIFLVCVSMTYIPATAMIMLPGINFSGINKNFFQLLYLIRFLFDSINASINFFFYIRVSSRYKAAFTASFPCWSSLNRE